MDTTTFVQDLDNLIDLYRPSDYNGTEPVTSISMGTESALLSFETTAMATDVSFREPIIDELGVRNHVAGSIERSIQEHSEVWDELSKL